MSENKGFYVMTFGGGQYQSVAWYSEKDKADKHVARIKAMGSWSGMPPKVQAL